MNCPRPSRARRAFTLVELLVVIGIIALLMSILLPTLGRVRAQASTIKCASNMRSIIQAMTIYQQDNKGFIIPAGTPTGGWWSNILADNGYLKVPTADAAEVAAGKLPMAEGVLYCPDGVLELFPPDLTNNGSVPSSRTDARGAMASRHTAPKTKVTTDVWYGINASTDAGSPFRGTPVRRVENANDQYMKFNYIRRPAEMALLFDGIIYHHMNVNANRVNARHMNNTQTNIGCFDGHIETWKTAQLPGGVGVAKTSDFSLANLNANHSGGGQPKWLMEQN